MDWAKTEMDRLYELYVQQFRDLRADVTEVNRSLGSAKPEKTWMELLERAEFETLLTTSSGDPEVVQRWVRSIIRGHEDEFPESLVA